ncbi:MAG: energy-coupling factor ABC transporter ATP-binding protein [Salinarimonas sp.]
MIEIEAIRHRVETTTILHELSLNLGEGRIGIIGANGSGKSTFARLLNGLILPSAGRIRVYGHDTRKAGDAVRALVGFVFQNPDHQIVYPIVEEDVGFGLRNAGLRGEALRHAATDSLARFGLTDKRNQPAHLLSGGEKQLLALAGILAIAPRTIVLDEPTALLDLRNRRKIARILADLPQQIVLVTHDLDMLDGFDRVLVFDSGRIVADDTPARAIAHYVDLMEA